MVFLHLRNGHFRPHLHGLDEILQSQQVTEAILVVETCTVLRFGEEARALYNKVAWMTIVLWTLYPVVWIIAEGQRMVSASMEGN